MREIFWRGRFVNHDSSAVHRAARRRRDPSLPGASRELLANVQAPTIGQIHTKGKVNRGGRRYDWIEIRRGYLVNHRCRARELCVLSVASRG